MLGLDTGWNCHISLGNDTSITSKKLTDEQLSTMSKADIRAETSCELKINPPDRTFFNKLSIFKSIRTRENFKLRKYKKLKKSNFLDTTIYTSLPDLKIQSEKSKSTIKNPFLEQYQLSKYEMKDDMKWLKACKLRKRWKLKRLNSSCSYYESSDSNISNELDNSKTNLLNKPDKLPDVESVKILKSHLSTKNMEDEISSSHRTIYSGRSLSEIELGNAVSLFFSLL